MSKIVVLDPGHGQYGNPYPAASGYYEGTQLWKLGQYLGARLSECGIKVINTRPSISMDPDLTVRGATAGKNKADMFISLHSDAVGSYATDNARGVSAYYSIQDSARNKIFASKLSAAVAALMGTRDRGALTRIGSGNLDYYGVIRSSAASGCRCAFLVEHGFHTSPSDVKFLISDEWLQKIAKVECQVICEFLGVTDTSTGANVTIPSTPVASTPTTTTSAPKATQKYTLNNTVNVYMSASDAQNNRTSASKTKYEAGEYYVYKEYNGMLNISRTAGVAGGWVNPADNKTVVVPATNAEIVMDDDVSTIEYSGTVIKAELPKNAEKTVKYSTVIRYGQLATPEENFSTVQVNKSLVQGLEILKDYLNLSSISIVAGNVSNTAKFRSESECACPTEHVNGFGLDIICYDEDKKPIPSKIICTVACKIGFFGIGRLSEYVTHLDIRKESSKVYFDAVDGKTVKVDNIDDYFCVTQADINTYVTGIQKVEASVKIDESDDYIRGTQKISAVQLNKFIAQYNPNVDPTIAEAFIKFGAMYGIRGDIAFCQSCVETGYFKYAGSAVTPDQHNYCGLGVLSNGMKGNSFATVDDGVEAQIQHLFAYSCKESIPEYRTKLDPRFSYVTRGIAPKWVDLNRRWSSTDIYGQTILSVYKKLVQFVQ